ncbi:beta-glucuronidase [Kineococcus sp. NUM-3379]
MLRPQDNRCRERKNLDGMWRLRLDPGGHGRDQAWFAGPLAQARDVPVPASYNDLYVDAAVRDHIGAAWYQREVWVPRGWAGRRIVLHLESATHRATVWVGDAEVVRHEGGYTPFEVDVTDHVSPGEPARLTVEVDNTLTFQTIPPGVVLDTPHGRRQKYWHDFFNYSGLHRSVWLYSTDPAHLTGVTVVTDLDGDLGLVRWTSEVVGAGDLRVGVVLRDAAGAVVATGTGDSGVLEVPGVHRWAPGDGYLHDLELRLHRGEDLLDEYHQSVGVRTVRVDGTRFLVNGEPFSFKGFAMHEDVPVLGKGHNAAYLVHDFELLRWSGANSVRTTHYPYSEDFLDHADRQGVLVIDETAAVGLNMGIGGGVFGAQGYTTYTPETVNEVTQAVHAQAIRELIARDRNHPSVVLWSIANEPESQTAAGEEYFRPLFDVARAADPTRPVAFANVVLAPHGQCRVSQFGDVLLLNRYYGWYLDTGDLAAAEAHLEEELRAWAGEGKPVVVTEYGADTYPGLHAALPTPWTEEYQVEFYDMCHRVFDRIEAVVGEQAWVFADFTTTSGVMRVGGNRKGVFTRDRLPKAAAHALRRRWRGEDR